MISGTRQARNSPDGAWSATGLEFSSVASVNLEQVFASGNKGGVFSLAPGWPV